MRLLTTLLLALTITSLSAQRINWDTFDNMHFNKCIIKKINSARTENVSFDSTCFQAAEMHGLYLVNNKMTSEEFATESNNTYGGHLELSSKVTKTMNQRLSYFRGKSVYAAEVCAILKARKGETYCELADRVLSQYLSSELHRPFFFMDELSAVGGTIHVTESGQIYSVIVFAHPYTGPTLIPAGNEEAIYDSVLAVRDSIYQENLRKGWVDKLEDGEVMEFFLMEYESKRSVNIQLGLSTDTILGIDYNTYLICQLVYETKKSNSPKTLLETYNEITADLAERKATYESQKKPL